MIVSVHIPKTAGRSFEHDLAEAFGPRALFDYGDWTESEAPEAIERNARRREAMLAQAETIAERYDVVHGHFAAAKYAGVFASAAFVTMVRDPYQHAISTYEHALRLTELEHPGFQRFKDERMTLVDLIEAFPNHQSLFLRGVALDDLAMVGLSEHYARSVALFEAVFGVRMPRSVERRNANPRRRDGADYDVSSEVRSAVERHRAEDLDLYRRARERFAALCVRHGV